MKKKVAKIFEKYGDEKIELVKNYEPKSKKKSTTAISGSRRDINNAIGNVILKAKRDEKKLIGEVLIGDFFEDWDSGEKTVIKY